MLRHRTSLAWRLPDRPSRVLEWMVVLVQAGSIGRAGGVEMGSLMMSPRSR